MTRPRQWKNVVLTDDGGAEVGTPTNPISVDVVNVAGDPTPVTNSESLDHGDADTGVQPLIVGGFADTNPPLFGAWTADGEVTRASITTWGSMRGAIVVNDGGFLAVDVDGGRLSTLTDDPALIDVLAVHDPTIGLRSSAGLTTDAGGNGTLIQWLRGLLARSSNETLALYTREANTWSTFRTTSGAGESSRVIKATPGRLRDCYVVSTHTTDVYLMLFNAAALPANGTVPEVPGVLIPPGFNGYIDFGVDGLIFTVGMVAALSDSPLSLTITPGAGAFGGRFS
jgi:hypothetical protein